MRRALPWVGVLVLAAVVVAPFTRRSQREMYLCHMERAHEVLNVGCGIGIGCAYLAKKHGCRVVGVGISEKMIEWARKRAHMERVGDKVEFRVADILKLPFEDDRFDAVIVESVMRLRGR